jgi:hypothetical protein
MGFTFKYIKKSIYIDGHERPGVIEYRNYISLKLWEKNYKRFIIFNEAGTWNLLLSISPTKIHCVSYSQ